ncbi:MAG: PIN domain-containing protein [Deltaproteobacteria bacterium]|nr:PIN domain-containing protein [Deltaproteobacteria bacterium]
MDRVFLDANVLYSAAFLEQSGLARLWTLEDVELLTSAYGLEEARRNLLMDRPEAVRRTERLCKAITTVNALQGLKLPANVQLDDKDQPILLAAIQGRAHYLLTGDTRHFAHLYGKRIATVLVLRPAQYLTRRHRP